MRSGTCGASCASAWASTWRSRRVDCETYQADLPDLLYGELDAEARASGEAHRRACAACDGLTRELQAVKGALPPLRPPPLLAARLKLAARDELLDRGGVAVDAPPPREA